MKRIFSVITSLMIAMTIITPISAETKDKNLDNTDLLIVAHNFMGDDNELWPDSLEELEIVPLYDLNNDIVAQYLKFSNAGYAVINNDKNNPTAIEFGYEDNALIRKILNNNSQPHIIYNSPTSLYDLYANDVNAISNDAVGYYEQYADLTTRNNDLASMLAESKQVIENVAVPYDSWSDYGFIEISKLPSGDCTIDNLLQADRIKDWATTSQFDKYANNHCGVIAVLNFAYYYSKVGFSKLYYGTHKKTFDIIYPKYVSDGPVVSLTPKLTVYIASCSDTYRSHKNSVYGNSDFKEAIYNEHMLILCLADLPSSAHWVLGIGYRDYNNGTFYLRLVDGWSETSTYYYQPHKGPASYINGYEYWVTLA